MAKRRHNERGVEVIEVALIIPVLILICFGVVDLLRISYFESMLQRAASDIAVNARSAPNLDYELRDFDLNSGEYYDFVEARNRAVAAGLSIADSAFSAPGTPSDAQLVATQQVDTSLGNYTLTASLTPSDSRAVILRPGEQATFSYVDDSGTTVPEVVTHPVIKPDINGNLPPQRMNAMLELAPIHVEVRAVVRPLLYFALGTRVVRGVATTYREKGIRRVVMRDSAGVDVAPLTASRRTGGPEVWLNSAEPLEPPPAPEYDWITAFNDARNAGECRCAEPVSFTPLPTMPCDMGI
jgi:Flp pilus assembly protein TadG